VRERHILLRQRGRLRAEVQQAQVGCFVPVAAC